MKKEKDAPTIKLLDRWENEVEGIKVVYQSKTASGGGNPTFYPANCLPESEHHFILSGAFDEPPTREQAKIHSGKG